MEKEFVLWDNGNKRKVTVEAKKIGQEWKAFCPFHDDKKTPNLYINDLKNVYYCFVCGAKGHLFEPGFTNPGRTITDIYNYEDENRNLIYQVLKYDKTKKGSKFLQRRPDGKGGFVWNLQGIDLIPYNLPELARKSEKPIFIVEGEKDCKSLEKLGLLATTNSGGAGKWKNSYSKWFKNRNIIVIPDNDKPGLDHSNEIIKSLKEVAKSIKRLTLPGLEKGGDITDWINKGGNLEKLHKIMVKTPEIDKEDIAGEEKGNSTKEKKQKKIKTKTLIPGLIHLVKEGEQASYLLQREGNLFIEETFTGVDETIYQPKSDLPIHYCREDIIKEPRQVDYASLLQDIIQFMKRYLELPDDKGYLLLALWVFHSYIIEKLDTTPILYFKGVKETGKTRAGEVLAELAYKCERLTSPTEATLFRSAEYFKTALVVDEIQLWGKEGNQAVGRLIKSRYKRGMKVSRINQNKSGEDEVEYFDVFGPLAISTTETVPNIIESRCIIFLMQKNKNAKVEKFIDKELARKIRNKLTIFRANFIDKQLPEVNPVSRRRLNEILSPLHRVLMAIDPDMENEFKLTVKNLERFKDTEAEFTLEAEIVEAVVDWYKNHRETSFLTNDIVDILNDDRKEKEFLSSKLISNRLANLGFRKTRLNNGKRGFTFELEFLEELAEQYSVENIDELPEKRKDLFDVEK